MIYLPTNITNIFLQLVVLKRTVFKTKWNDQLIRRIRKEYVLDA